MNKQAIARKNNKIGTVVSNKMEKSITVVVDRLVMHPTVKKYIKKRSKFMAHDEKNEAKIGDVVRIIESRPLSKNKRWRLDAILKKNISAE